VKLSSPPLQLSLPVSGQKLTVVNDGPSARRIKIEDSAERPTVLTAVRAAARANGLKDATFVGSMRSDFPGNSERAS
jgi:hypothetical protein